MTDRDHLTPAAFPASSAAPYVSLVGRAVPAQGSGRSGLFPVQPIGRDAHSLIPRRWSVSFSVKGPPQTAGSKRAFMRGGRPIVVDDNPRSKAWKESIAGVARAAMNGRAPLEGPLAVEFEFVLARPKNHWLADGSLSAEGKRKLHHAIRPDALKLGRAVEDAMTGWVYVDDGQIVEERLTKRYQSRQDESPGVVVKVRSL